MAKFNKGGGPFNEVIHPYEGKAAAFRKITKPSFRDQRKYAEVVMGKKKISSKVIADKTIPVNFTIEVSENKEIVKLLD